MNKLCEELGIKYPIIQAGMAGGATTPELVSAVSNAGGLGILSATQLTPIQLKEAIFEIKSKTQNPFGVNILLAPPEDGNYFHCQLIWTILEILNSPLTVNNFIRIYHRTWFLYG